MYLLQPGDPTKHKGLSREGKMQSSRHDWYVLYMHHTTFRFLETNSILAALKHAYGFCLIASVTIPNTMPTTLATPTLATPTLATPTLATPTLATPTPATHTGTGTITTIATPTLATPTPATHTGTGTITTIAAHKSSGSPISTTPPPSTAATFNPKGAAATGYVINGLGVAGAAAAAAAAFFFL